MGRLTSRAERAAIRKDLVWALLWSLPRLDGTDVGWYRSRDLYEAWLDGRPFSGCVFYGDYFARSLVTPDLRRLVADGRAEERKRPGRHPEWRALEPEVGP